MSNKNKRPSRGRPQTLERDQVLQTALLRYWKDGPKNVSINDISLESGASKPGIYREFGNDDGLKEAALQAYGDMVLNPLFDILASDQNFDQALNSLIKFTVQDRLVLGIPNGCLHVVMRSQRDDFGPLTQLKIDQLRQDILEKYTEWINRAKAKGQFGTDMSTETAALYFDAINGSAMGMQKEGVGKDVIEEILQRTLSIFRC